MKTAMLQRLLFPLAVSLSSCTLMIDPLANNLPPFENVQKATVESLYTDLSEIGEPVRKPVIAVYPDGLKIKQVNVDQIQNTPHSVQRLLKHLTLTSYAH